METETEEEEDEGEEEEEEDDDDDCWDHVTQLNATNTLSCHEQMQNEHND